ncbi:membrane protein, partial [Xanthomonas cannabis]
MRPQAEFIALSTLAGGAAIVFATALQQLSLGMPWSDTFKWALPALVAAGIGAWLAGRWQRRRDARVPTRRSGGMAVRTVLLSALSYVPVVALYLAVAFAVSGDAT